MVFSREKLTFSTKPYTFLLSWPAVRVFVYSRFAHVVMMEKQKRESFTLKSSKEKKKEI